MSDKIQGPSINEELTYEMLGRDTRTGFQKFLGWWRVPANIDGIAVALIILILVFPAATELGAFFGFLLCLRCRGLRAYLPIRLPSTAGITDYNDPLPGREGEYYQARGIMYLGKDRQTGEEVWLSNDDARRHALTIGTTGSGKTEYKLGLSANAMCWSSGFIFMDGKADVKLWGSMRSLARRFGRDDDLFILNFMQGGKEMGGNSHTMNPFATTTTSMINNLIESLMPPGGGSNDMWQQRAQAFSAAVNRLMVDLRNQKHVLFNAFTLAEMMPLKALVSAFYGRRIEMGVAGSPNHQVIQNYRLSSKTREELKRYLESLAGFNWTKAGAGEDQDSKPLEQHGFLMMQFTKILSSLATSYDYIFQKPIGDIDLNDVVINRRILVVLLPTLEKSSDETANLGKITVALLKAMMATSLGDQIEGFTQDIIDNRPTTSMSPMPVFKDEVGYYFVKGMAVMAAQARSLGFGLFFGAQDDQAMRRGGGELEQEVNAVIANTNLKSFGKVEDADNTYSLARKTGGETFVGRASGFSQNFGLFSSSNLDRGDVSVEKVDRISYDDLKGQREGQFHLIYGNTISRASVFYVPLVSLRVQRRTRFVTVRPPEVALRNFQKEAVSEAIAGRVSRPDWSIPGRLAGLHRAGSRVTAILQASSLDHVAAIWARSKGHQNPSERAAATLFALVYEDRMDWRGKKGHFTDDFDAEGDKPSLLIEHSDPDSDPSEAGAPADSAAPADNSAPDVSGDSFPALSPDDGEDFYVPPPQEIDVIEDNNDADAPAAPSGPSAQTAQSGPPARSGSSAGEGSRVSFGPKKLDSFAGRASGRSVDPDLEQDHNLTRLANAVRKAGSGDTSGKPVSDNMRNAVAKNFARSFLNSAISAAAKETDEGDDQGEDTGEDGNQSATAIDTALNESLTASDSFIDVDGDVSDASLYGQSSKSDTSRSIAIDDPRSVNRRGFARVRSGDDTSDGDAPFDAADYDEVDRDAVVADREMSGRYAEEEVERQRNVRVGHMLHTRLRSRLSISETAFGLEAMRIALEDSGDRAFLRASRAESIDMGVLCNVIADGMDAYTSTQIDPDDDGAASFFRALKSWKSTGGEGFTAEDSEALVSAISSDDVEGVASDFVPEGIENPLANVYRRASLALWEAPETIKAVTEGLRDISQATGRTAPEAKTEMEQIVSVAVAAAVPPSEKSALMPSGQAAREAVRARIGQMVAKSTRSSSGEQTEDDGSADTGTGEIVGADLGDFLDDAGASSAGEDASGSDALSMMKAYRSKKAGKTGDDSQGDADLSLDDTPL